MQNKKVFEMKCNIPWNLFTQREWKICLQAGVFVSDINKAFYAFEHLEVGGVVINDVPSMRIDSQVSKKKLCIDS